MRKLIPLYLLCIPSLFAQKGALEAGPMPGYSAKREVQLWLQTKSPASIQVQYWRQENPRQVLLTDPIETSMQQECVAHVSIGNLEPGATYEYDVLVDQKKVPHTERWKFKTQPLWEWRTDPPAFTVAFGSCAYVNEPEYDRPGKPYGSDYSIFDTIAAVRPDLMLWLGDNTYLREVDWDSRSGILHRYRHTRSLQELQRLLSCTHHYATWDDHDYGPNNSDRSYGLKGITLDAFKLYWANPSYGLDNAPGVFYQFRWNDVDFFVLDDRFHRSPNTEKANPAKTMLGAEQKQWLKDALLGSRAPFKVIVSGTQMISTSGGDEAFNLFADERSELLSFIKSNRIPGVLFLSGDVHHSELLKLEDPEFYPLYDFTSSSLTAGLYVPKDKEISPMMVPGTLVSDQHNFGILRFDGKFRDRTLTMETRDITGNIRWSVSIHERDLRPENTR